MKKGLVIVGIFLSGLLLVGCGNSKKKTANSATKVSSIVLDSSDVKGDTENKFDISGNTGKNVKLYLLNNSGQSIDSFRSKSDGTFVRHETGSKKAMEYYLTSDKNIQTGTDDYGSKLKNSINNLKNYKALSFTPNPHIADKALASSKSESKEISSEVDSEMAASSKKAKETSNTTGSTSASKSSNYSAYDAYKKSIRQFAKNSTEYGISSVSFPTKEVHYYVDSSYADASNSTKKEIGKYLFNHTTKIGDMCDISVRPIYVYTTGGTLIARSTLTGGIKAE